MMTLQQAAQLAVEDLQKRFGNGRFMVSDAKLAEIQREAARLIKDRCPDTRFRVILKHQHGNVNIDVHEICEPSIFVAPPPPIKARAVPEMAPQSLARAKTYPISAVNDRKAIDIDGMIRDLGDWRVPPHLINGERVGYYEAVSDIMNYLMTRQRRG